MKITTFLPLLFVVLLSSCRPYDDPGVNCTTDYRMLTVTIKDTASKPVILSNYIVKKTSTGEIVDFSKEDLIFDSINRLQGIYLVCTDGMMGMTSSNGTQFEFHGFRGDQEIVNEKYVIGHDQCHITMISGKQQIVISN